MMAMELDKELVGQFIDAVVNDEPQAVQLLRQYPELRDARWRLNETVLHFLAVEGYTEGVRRLCKMGFDVNAPNEFGDAPLIDVAVLGNDEIAAILIEHGADPNATSETRDNALHCAVQSGNAKLVDVLLSSGAKSDYKTPLGETIFNALPVESDKRRTIEEVLAQYGIRGGGRL
jgi:hypothetical protein